MESDKQGEYESRIIGPTQKTGEPIGEGDEVEINYNDESGNRHSHWFNVISSPLHNRLNKLVERSDSDSGNPTRAEAYFEKGKELIFDLTPDAVKGEEGKKFRDVMRGLGAAAVLGTAAAFIVVKHRKK